MKYFFMVICIILGVSVMAENLPPANIKLIAHRGESAVAPENTMAAFRVAWEGKVAYGIELDVHITKDDHIVCIHDENLTRVTQGACTDYVKDMTLAELKKCDVGKFKDPKYENERVPLLSEVFDELPEGGRIFLEVKVNDVRFPKLLKEVLSKYPNIQQEQITIISFHGEALFALRQNYPGFKQYLLGTVSKPKEAEMDISKSRLEEIMRDVFLTPEEVIVKLKEYQCDGFDAGRLYNLTPEYVKKVKEAGYEFHVWTIDDPTIAAMLLKNGVQSVTTNKPTEIYPIVLEKLKE